jgi:hypothetical protein
VSVKLYQYKIIGVPRNLSQLCYYFRFEDVETIGSWAGRELPDIPLAGAPARRYIDPLSEKESISGYFPLYLFRPNNINDDVDCTIDDGPEICGTNGWPKNKQLILTLYDEDLQKPTYTKIALSFIVVYDSNKNNQYNTPGTEPGSFPYISSNF